MMWTSTYFIHSRIGYMHMSGIVTLALPLSLCVPCLSDFMAFRNCSRDALRSRHSQRAVSSPFILNLGVFRVSDTCAAIVRLEAVPGSVIRNPLGLPG